MSDEKLRELPSFQADQIKTLYKKITALEKRLDSLEKEIEGLKSGTMASDNNTGIRLTELEKKLGSYRNEIYDNFKIEFDDIDKQIAELKEVLLKHLQECGDPLWEKLDSKEIGSNVHAASAFEKNSDDAASAVAKKDSEGDKDWFPPVAIELRRIIELSNKKKLDSGDERGELEKDLNAIGIFPVNDSGDEKTVCEHEEWEFRDPENIGHDMAFCKKCGYLRDSKLPEPIGEVDRQANKIFSEYKEWEHNHKFKEQILKDFEKRLNEPIPTFYAALIKEGKMTEEEYYIKSIPNQLFIKRQRRIVYKKILERILSFNYTLPTEPQIIEIREWLKGRLKK